MSVPDRSGQAGVLSSLVSALANRELADRLLASPDPEAIQQMMELAA